MLYFVGLGLGDERDITVRGLEAVKECERVYLEHYTSVLGVDKDRLEAFYGKKVELADREKVENEGDAIVEQAKSMNVAFLVVGDPFGATTHSDLFVRAKKEGIRVEVIHNASIMNAIGSCGLQLYRFGETITVPFFTETWRPDSFYDKIAQNHKLGLHTLVLVDIKVKEISEENLARGRSIYEPPRFMTVKQCAEQLLEVEERRGGGVCGPEARVFGVARIGQPTQQIVAGTLQEMLDIDFGPPLHSMVLVGDTHFMEDEMFEFFRQST